MPNELASVASGLPEIVLRPMLLLLIPHRLRQPLGQRERQSHGMFGHDRAVDIARVGDHDIAGA